MWEWRFSVTGHPINKSPLLAIRRENWKLLLNPARDRVGDTCCIGVRSGFVDVGLPRIVGFWFGLSQQFVDFVVGNERAAHVGAGATDVEVLDDHSRAAY